MADNIQSTQTGQGLLKVDYPASQDMSEALKKRKKKLQAQGLSPVKDNMSEQNDITGS